MEFPVHDHGKASLLRGRIVGQVMVDTLGKAQAVERAGGEFSVDCRVGGTRGTPAQVAEHAALSSDAAARFAERLAASEGLAARTFLPPRQDGT